MTTIKLAVLYAFLLLACASCPDDGGVQQLESRALDPMDASLSTEDRAEAANSVLRQKINRAYSEYKQADFPDIADLSVAETLQRLDSGLVFIDARSEEERAISTLPSALSLEAFRLRLEKYPQLKDSDLIVYCTIGYRSALLTMTLRGEGLRAYNLQGGILAWVANGQIVQNGSAVSKRIHTYGKQWNYVPAGYEAIY